MTGYKNNSGLWSLNDSKVSIKNIFQDKPINTLEYQQHNQNICYSRSLASDFCVSEELVSAKIIKTRITALLYYKSHDYTDRIKFENAIMDDKERKKGQQRIRYKLKNTRKKVVMIL